MYAVPRMCPPLWLIRRILTVAVPLTAPEHPLASPSSTASLAPNLQTMDVFASAHAYQDMYSHAFILCMPCPQHCMSMGCCLKYGIYLGAGGRLPRNCGAALQRPSRVS